VQALLVVAYLRKGETYTDLACGFVRVVDAGDAAVDGAFEADQAFVARAAAGPRPARPPLAELADADAVYGYSFILTKLDVSTPDNAADGEVVLDRAR